MLLRHEVICAYTSPFLFPIPIPVPRFPTPASFPRRRESRGKIHQRLRFLPLDSRLRGNDAGFYRDRVSFPWCSGLCKNLFR